MFYGFRHAEIEGGFPIDADSDLVGFYDPEDGIFRVDIFVAFAGEFLLIAEDLAFLKFVADGASTLLVSEFDGVWFMFDEILFELFNPLFFAHFGTLRLVNAKTPMEFDLILDLLIDQQLYLT